MAGIPAKTMPCMTLNNNKISKEGENASTIVMNDAAKMEKVINRFRPQASDNDPNKIKLKDRATVEADNDKLATAGETWNSSENCGNKGCVMYKFAKIINPAANNAKFVNVNSRVPFWIYTVLRLFQF